MTMTRFSHITARQALIDANGNICLVCEAIPGRSTVRISREELLWLWSLPHGGKFVEIRPRSNSATFCRLDELVARYPFTTGGDGKQYMLLGQTDLWNF